MIVYLYKPADIRREQISYRHFSQNIWNIPQTDAGNKKTARGATLPKEMREGILQHTPTLPPALHPAFHTISCSPQKSMKHLYKNVNLRKTKIQSNG